MLSPTVISLHLHRPLSMPIRVTMDNITSIILLELQQGCFKCVRVAKAGPNGNIQRSTLLFADICVLIPPVVSSRSSF